MLEEFCGSYNLKSYIKKSTCFKNLENPEHVDNILIIHPKSFHPSKNLKIENL